MTYPSSSSSSSSSSLAPSSALLLAVSSAILGSILTLTLDRVLFHPRQQQQRQQGNNNNNNDNDNEKQQQHHQHQQHYDNITNAALHYAEDRRNKLPQFIFLIRHGESEANVDKTLWSKIPDNLVGLTGKGRQQARDVGQRVEQILHEFNCTRVHLVVSPFERTLQTSSELRKACEHRIVRTDIESRIREQEIGNLQNEEYERYRLEQKKVGRFFYRFPTGESGADVFDRVKSWWYESVLTVNTRFGYEPIDAMIVVTHGLSVRFMLMQLFGWSPTTFHSVYNAGNCEMYVLRKDLSQPGTSPYVLDKERGDMPRSSIDVMIELRLPGVTEQTAQMQLKLENYLSIPPPRTTRIDLVKTMLAKQYPDIVSNANDIVSVIFMPFVEGAKIIGRSSSGIVTSNHSWDINNLDDDDDDDDIKDMKNSIANDINRHVPKEKSGRFPYFENDSMDDMN